MKYRYSSLTTGFLFATATCYAQTPQQIVTEWSQLSGSSGGKVVYGVDRYICVLNLLTGKSDTIANYSPAGAYRWSANGRRIMVQNPDNVSVLNSDGSGMKTIATPHQCSDLIWGDWDGNDKIVYSTGSKVVRTAINTDNTAGATVNLVTEAPYRCWSSVSIDGDYLAYNNIEGNKPYGGYHQPRILKISTGSTVRLVADNSDGCQLAILVGHGGRATFMVMSHTRPSDIGDYTGKVVGHIPQITGCGSTGSSLCPQRAHAWSNNREYFVNQGDGSSFKWTWIRKYSTMGGFIISRNMSYPDLYVEGKSGTGAVIGKRKGHGRLDADGRYPGLYDITGRNVGTASKTPVVKGLYLKRRPDSGRHYLPELILNQ